MKLSKYIGLVVSTICILVLPHCKRYALRKKLNISHQELNSSISIPTHDQPPAITVWVHGTKLISRPFFQKLLFVPQGLTKAVDLDPCYYHRTMAETLAQHDPARFPLEHFYFFGWSGALNFKARETAAQDFYTSLSQLVDEYKKNYETNPVLRIITHSHGGNVALNMKCFNDKNLFIDELILLACPVQQQTSGYTQDPMFKKIYSLFSTLDSIQILDPQGLYRATFGRFRQPILSERTFEHAPHILQAKLKINGHGVLHVGFLMTSFLRLLPHILKKLDTYHAQMPQDQSRTPLLLSIKKRRYR